MSDPYLDEARRRGILADAPDPYVAEAQRRGLIPATPEPAPVTPPEPPPVMADGTPAVPGAGTSTVQTPTFAQSAGQGLAIGTRGLLKGAFGAPVDLMTGALNVGAAGVEHVANALPGVDNVHMPRISSPVGGSQSIGNLADTAANAAGIHIPTDAEMPETSRLAEAASEGAGAALGPSLLLREVGMARAAEPNRMPRLTDSFVKPYESGSIQPVVGDVAAGAGAGAAVRGYNDSSKIPDAAKGPLADFIISLMGGIGGHGVSTVAQSPKAAVTAIRDHFVPEMGLPMEDGRAFTRAEAEKVARFTQGAADNPTTARLNIADRAAEARAAGLPSPTTGILSGDIGLGAMENGLRVRNSVPFTRADQNVRTAVSDKLDGLNDPKAKPQDVPAFFDNEVAQRTGAADAKVDTAEQANLAALAAEQAHAAPYAVTSTPGTASEALDKVVVQDTLKPRQAEKNAKFEAIPDAQRDSTPFKQAAAAVRDTVGTLNDPEKVLPQSVLARIDALGDKVSFADLNKLRPELSSAEAQARKEGNYLLADNVRSLKREISAEADRMATEGSPEAKDAADYYRNEFAPVFGDGTTGGKLKADINADPTRGSTPPTGTASRFLFTGDGSKEAAADLQKILKIAPNPDAGRQAARSYVLSDLTKTMDSNGTINPGRLKAWVKNRADMLSQMPELDTEVQKLVQDVVNNRAKSNVTAVDLKAAMRDAKLTDQEINRGALGLVLNKNPNNAVRDVLGSGNPEKAMADVMKIVEKDPAAKAGWRQAVKDHLNAKVRGTNTELTDSEEPAVGMAAMSRYFKQNASALGKVFTPEEMNAMQQMQKEMSYYGALSRRATTSSPTAENLANSKLFKAASVAWRLFRGQLTGGGEIKGVKSSLDLMKDETDGVQKLVLRFAFDPDVAVYLLKYPVKDIGTPTWNAKMNTIMGLAAPSRVEGEKDKKTVK